MVVEQETILDVVRRNGPLLPAQLAKAIGTDILIASAHLSYLVDNKKVLISNTKVGASPVYYIEGQQQKLQDFVSNLNAKDQKTFSLLKERKVLRDDKQDQLTRLSLRTIKDFAVPLQVTRNKEKILFWKWYLMTNKEAEGYIKKALEVKASQNKILQDKAQQKPAIKQAAKPVAKPEEKPVEIAKPDFSALEKEKKQLEEERKKLEQERKNLEQRKLEESKTIEKKQTDVQQKLEDERKKIEEEKKRFIEEKEKLQKQMVLERQSMLKEIESKKKEIRKQVVVKEKKEEDPFFEQLMFYFKEKRIILVKHKVIRKKADIDLILKIPSVVGEIEYYCKAKNKKTISDTDLSSAVVQGQLKKLPVLFLGTGELTKKAKELLNTEMNKGILVKKI